MVNAVNSEAFRNLHEHVAVIHVGDLRGWNLCDVQGDAVDIRVRFANVDEARRDEKIYEAGEFESLNAVLVELSSFVVDHRNFQFVLRLQGARPGRSSQGKPLIAQT